MGSTYSRRSILEKGVGSLLGLSLLELAACGSTPGTTASTETLQMVFWGPATRDKVNKQAINLFQTSHANIKITSQYSGFDVYWNKLNTQIASGSIPDLIQMDMRYLAQYVKKGQLLDLSSLIADKTIDLSDFDAGLLDSSKDNGVVYGVPMGGNYQTMVYDTDLLTKSKVGAPPANMTWDTYATYTTAISKALGAGVYGASDDSGAITSFELWIRQHGTEMYTADGKLGFTVEQATEWFNYWSNLRKAGGCVPPDVQTSLNAIAGPQVSTLIHGKAVFNPTLSNLFDAYQKLSTHNLELMPVPNGATGSTPGMYLKPSMLLSVAAKSTHAKDAASFIGFINNDAGAVKALGLDRGTPGSTKARTLLNAQLTVAQKKVMAYFTLIAQSNNTSGKKVLDPAGASAVADALVRASQAIGFGHTPITDGSKAFYAEAQKLLV